MIDISPLANIGSLTNLNYLELIIFRLRDAKF